MGNNSKLVKRVLEQTRGMLWHETPANFDLNATSSNNNVASAGSNSISMGSMGSNIQKAT